MNIDLQSGIDNSVSSSSAQSSDAEIAPNVLTSNDLRAKWMVNNNKVHLVPNLQVFNVSNENNDVFVVKLNPEKCSCPEVKGCSHIKAVNLSIGKNHPNLKKKLPNLSQLRANKRNQKKSGRKYRDNITSPESKKSKTSESKTDMNWLLYQNQPNRQPVNQ